MRFLSESLTRFCPDFEKGGSVRYGLKMELLKASPLWTSEIQPRGMADQRRPERNF